MDENSPKYKFFIKWIGYLRDSYPKKQAIAICKKYKLSGLLDIGSDEFYQIKGEN